MLSRSWKDHFREFVCGGGAAFCNITISYPLNKIIFRQMMHGVHSQIALNQLRDEGIVFLYRGMLPPLLQRTASMSVMFGVYHESHRPLIEWGMNPYLAKTIGGLVAGTVEAILMPFERIQTLLIHPKYHHKFKNTFDAYKFIAANYGIKEFYRGFEPVLWRNGPSNVAFFILREDMNKFLPTQKNPFYKSIQDFIAGASIGALLSTAFYPLNVIKIAMQCELGAPHRSMTYEFLYIYRKRHCKVLNLYHGVMLNCSRAFISWGIINASYEVFRRLLY